MDAPRLRSLLLRGSVIAAANWPVVLAQGIAESVVKVLAGIPLAGAAVLLLLVSVPNAAPGPPVDSAAAALTALATAPAALAGVAVSALVAALGAIAFGAAIKAGAVAVIVAGEARAHQVPAGPLRASPLGAAHAWSRARFMRGCRHFGPRFVRLGLALAALEVAIALAYATAVVQAYRAFVSVAASWWIRAGVLAVSLIALAVSIAAELGYRLTQLALVVEDGGIGERRPPRPRLRATRAAARGAPLPRGAAAVDLAFVIALLAAAAFGLVSFVPVAGVAVLPLQAAVWVVRGLMLPFIDLAALAAYRRCTGGRRRRRRGRPAGGTGAAGGVAGAVAAGGGSGIPGGGAGTVRGVPGSAVMCHQRVEAAASAVQHALLGDQDDHVLEHRRPPGDERARASVSSLARLGSGNGTA